MILLFFTMKEIVNQRKSSDPPATERLYLFYSVKIPPLWKLEVSPLNLGIQFLCLLKVSVKTMLVIEMI